MQPGDGDRSDALWGRRRVRRVVGTETGLARYRGGEGSGTLCGRKRPRYIVGTETGQSREDVDGETKAR